MKISTLAVAALVTSLSAAIIAPAAYAEDAAPTTTTPAPACDPKDPKCKPDATTDGTAAPSTEGSAPATGSDS